jgi:long-chain fatty acid transport protein
MKKVMCHLREKRLFVSIIIIGIVCFLVTHFPINAYAFLDFTRVIGFNAGAIGRGGTSIAIGDDPSNMNVNPALISEIKSNALDGNLLLIHPDFDFKYTGTGGRRYTSTDKDRLLFGPGFSYVHKIKDSSWSWGFYLSAPDAIATDYTIQSKNFGPTNGFSELLHLRFGPAVAYQLTPNLSLGARFGIDYGSLDLRLPLGLASIDIGQTDGWGFSAAVGLLYKLEDNLNIGVYYETPTFMQDLEAQDRDGYVSIVTPGGKVDFPNIKTKIKDLKWPQNFGLGVSYKPLPQLRLSADVKYINWERDWDELKVKLGTPGLPSVLKVPTHIDNQVTFGIGAEYFFSEIYCVALGYHYGDNAMENNFLNPFIPATAEHTITAGFSVKPTKNIKIGLSYAYAIMDGLKARPIHGYDVSLERQLGLPFGSLSSELSGSKTNLTAHGLQISLSIYW